MRKISETGYAPSWSPDGSRIAFEDQASGGDSTGRASEIFTMNADGTGMKRLTDVSRENEGVQNDYDQTSNSGPVWSPDGQQIMFRRCAGRSQLCAMWLMDPDGGRQRSFLSDPRIDYIRAQWYSVTPSSVRGDCNGIGCAESRGAKILVNDERRIVRRVKRAKFARSGFVLSGRLVDTAGHGIGNAKLDVLQRVTVAGGRELKIDEVQTNGQGKWRIRLKKGPSRVVSIGYRKYAFDSGYVARSRAFQQRVKSGVTLQIARRMKKGSSGVVSGRLLGGYAPNVGKVVEIQVRFRRRWRVLKTVRSDRNGIYKDKILLHRAGRYQLRTNVRSGEDWPFLSAVSKTQVTIIK